MVQIKNPPPVQAQNPEEASAAKPVLKARQVKISSDDVSAIKRIMNRYSAAIAFLAK